MSNRSRGALCEDGLVEGAVSGHESSVKEAERENFPAVGVIALHVF